MVTTEEQHTEGAACPNTGALPDPTSASDTDMLIRLRDALRHLDS